MLPPRSVRGRTRYRKPARAGPHVTAAAARAGARPGAQGSGGSVHALPCTQCGAMFRLPLRTVAADVAGAVWRDAGTTLQHRPHRADSGCATHQRSVARKARPCSGASSLAGSLRVPSTPNATSGPRVQRTLVRHARPPVSESAIPA